MTPGPFWPASLSDEARAAHDERESEHAAEAERAARAAEHAPTFPLPHPSAPSTPTATGERRVVPDEVPPGVISAPGSVAALCWADTSDGPRAATGRRAAVAFARDTAGEYTCRACLVHAIGEGPVRAAEQREEATGGDWGCDWELVGPGELDEWATDWGYECPMGCGPDARTSEPCQANADGFCGECAQTTCVDCGVRLDALGAPS